MEKDRREFYRQLVDLSRRFGRFAEDFVAPNVPSLIESHFHCELTYFSERSHRTHRRDPQRKREFDIVAACEKFAFLCEVKTTPRDEYINAFLTFLESNEFFEFFPELEGKMLVPMFATFNLGADKIKHLTRKGVLVMTVSEGTMDFVNFDALKDRFT